MSHIEIDAPVARYGHQRLGGLVRLTIGETDVAAIIGPNGAGKSLLAAHIAGGVSLRSGRAEVLRPDGTRVPPTRIASLSFRDIYRLGGASADNYYQKRWQATENEQSPLVADALGRAAAERHKELLEAVGVSPLLAKRVIFLSSGELRKLMIARALMSGPELLIVDNPFIGLDAESRQSVSDLLAATARRLKVMLVVSHPKDLPPWANMVVVVEGRNVARALPAADFAADTALRRSLFADGEMTPAEAMRLLPATGPADNADYDAAIAMRGVRVAYGGTTILDGVDWTVRRGEKWALEGRNGSGKSTLLSLVCADNPQGYANDICLFGRRRGTGESIWDIKSRIGYVSPDMHTFYNADIACLDVVASGFFDTVGLYRRPDEAQRDEARRWMRAFGCEGLAERSFLRVSYGEQRLILLTRVFVKRPSLVILDEPLHGLDAGKKHRAKMLIEAYCGNPGVTMVYVTHYAEETPSIVRRRLTLRRGEATSTKTEEEERA